MTSSAAWVAYWLIAATTMLVAAIPELPAAESQPASQDPGPRTASRIPPAIADTQIERYVRMLNASEAQRVYISHLYEDYVKAWDVMLSQEWPTLDAMNAAVADPNLPGRGHAAVRRFAAFLQRQSEVESLCVELDDSLLAKMEAILAPVQRELMWRVRAHRARQRCDPFEQMIWESRIDLSRLVENQLALSDEDQKRIDPILIEYEEAVTPHFVAADRVQPHRMELAFSADAQVNFSVDDQPINAATVDPERAAAIWAQVTTLLAEETKHQKAIVEINRAFLPRLLAALAAHDADVLRDEYRKTAWRVVYPVRPEIDYLHKEIVRVGSLTDDQRTAIDDAWNQFRRRLEGFCTEMEREVSTWEEQLARTLAAADYGEYKARMRELRDRRLDCLDAMLITLKSLVPSTETRVLSLIELERRNVKRRRDEFRSDRWPGP